MQRFTSIQLTLEPNPNGVYTVTSPDVPGLVTEGRNPIEISANVQEALGVLMSTWEEFGLEVPPILRSPGDTPLNVEVLVEV